MKTEIWQEPPIPTTTEPSFQNVQAFMSDLVAPVGFAKTSYSTFPEGIHSYDRDWELVAYYLCTEGVDLPLIAKNKYNIKTTSLTLRARKFIREIHDLVDEEIREAHPLDGMLFYNSSPKRIRKPKVKSTNKHHEPRFTPYPSTLKHNEFLDPASNEIENRFTG